MFKTAARLTALASITALAGAALTGNAAAANHAVADQGPPRETSARAYKAAFPQISRAAAYRAADQQDERKALTTALLGTTFGGTWFDVPSGVYHIQVTTRPAAERAKRLARELGVKARVSLVGTNYVQFQRAADAIRKGDAPLSVASRGQVGMDIKAHKVVVAVPREQLADLRDDARAAGVKLIADPQIAVEADACSGRDVCDGSIAAGAMLWRSTAGSFKCSVGFTAEDPFTLTRFVYTAGHCSNGLGVAWGTGSQQIGTLVGSLDLNDIDASVIEVTNPLYTSQPGGRLYNTDDVDSVASTLGAIVIGDVVCLAANFQDPTGSRFCGVIGSVSDASVRGMVRVDNEDACSGDSGGTWYELSGNTRTGYGIHSRSNTGCHGDQGGSQSWFSALPTVKAGLAPGYDVETR